MNDIQQWMDDPQRDYNVGVALFARYSKNKAMSNNFARGTARFWMSKLTYELGKLIHCAEGVQRQKPVVVKTTVSSIKAVNFSETTSENTVPQSILAAKKEIASLYSIIDKMHTQLYDLGTSNDDDIVKKRKKLLDKRKPIIERADRLYVLKEDWFAGNKPVLKEIETLLSAPLKDQPSIDGAASAPAVPVHDTKTGIHTLTDLQLSKRKSQLRSYITKTKNILDFQSIRKGEHPTPMPEGPKRTEFETKLEELKAEYAEVLAELENRNA